MAVEVDHAIGRVFGVANWQAHGYRVISGVVGFRMTRATVSCRTYAFSRCSLSWRRPSVEVLDRVRYASHGIRTE